MGAATLQIGDTYSTGDSGTDLADDPKKKKRKRPKLTEKRDKDLSDKPVSKGHVHSEAHTGAMIALRPSQSDAKRLAHPDGTPVDELHVTVTYTPDVDKLTPAMANLMQAAAARAASPVSPMVLEFDHVELLGDEPEGKAVALVTSDRSAQRFHDRVVEAMDALGVPYSTKFPVYKPHLTLGYYHDGETPYEDGEKVNVTVTFDRLSVHWKNQPVASYPLGEGVVPSLRMPIRTPVTKHEGGGHDQQRHAGTRGRKGGRSGGTPKRSGDVRRSKKRIISSKVRNSWGKNAVAVGTIVALTGAGAAVVAGEKDPTLSVRLPARWHGNHAAPDPTVMFNVTGAGTRPRNRVQIWPHPGRKVEEGRAGVRPARGTHDDFPVRLTRSVGANQFGGGAGYIYAEISLPRMDRNNTLTRAAGRGGRATARGAVGTYAQAKPALDWLAANSTGGRRTQTRIRNAVRATSQVADAYNEGRANFSEYKAAEHRRVIDGLKQQFASQPKALGRGAIPIAETGPRRPSKNPKGGRGVVIRQAGGGRYREVKIRGDQTGGRAQRNKPSTVNITRPPLSQKRRDKVQAEIERRRKEREDFNPNATVFGKRLELVEKHPGHPDQMVHGNRRHGKGRRHPVADRRFARRGKDEEQPVDERGRFTLTPEGRRRRQQSLRHKRIQRAKKVAGVSLSAAAVGYVVAANADKLPPGLTPGSRPRLLTTGDKSDKIPFNIPETVLDTTARETLKPSRPKITAPKAEAPKVEAPKPEPKKTPKVSPADRQAKIQRRQRELADEVAAQKKADRDAADAKNRARRKEAAAKPDAEVKRKKKLAAETEAKRATSTRRSRPYREAKKLGWDESDLDVMTDAEIEELLRGG